MPWIGPPSMGGAPPAGAPGPAPALPVILIAGIDHFPAAGDADGHTTLLLRTLCPDWWREATGKVFRERAAFETFGPFGQFPRGLRNTADLIATDKGVPLGLIDRGHFQDEVEFDCGVLNERLTEGAAGRVATQDFAGQPQLFRQTGRRRQARRREIGSTHC